MSFTNIFNTPISFDSDNKFQQEYKASKQQRIEEKLCMEKALAKRKVKKEAQTIKQLRLKEKKKREEAERIQKEKKEKIKREKEN